MPLFILVFVIVFGIINLYLAYRFLRVFEGRLFLPKYVICILWVFLALAGILFRDDISFLPGLLTDYLYLAGAYWMFLSYYGFILTFSCDILNFLQKRSGIVIFSIPARFTASAIIAVLALSLFYGSYMADNPGVTHYNIHIDKKATEDKMRVVLVSDIHFGKIIDHTMADKMIAQINELQPDLVVFAGDTIDSGLDSVVRKAPMANFTKIKSRFGLYGVMGNHEYLRRESPRIASYLNEQGINLLIDKGVELPNGVLLLGRDDYSQSAKAKKLDQLLPKPIEKPVLLVDHQPRRIGEAVEAGVDLLVSGHTHLGQFFPNNIITGHIYEIDHGHKKFGNLHMIVSSGLGSWGPPIRIGSESEIVSIDISFAK